MDEKSKENEKINECEIFDENKKIYVHLKDYTKINECEIFDGNNKEIIVNEVVLEEVIKVLDEIGRSTNGRKNLLILTDDTEKEADNEVRLVKPFNGSYWTQNYVGLLQHENMTIFIGSRFDNAENCFLNYIMDKALNIRTFIFNDMRPQVTKDFAMEKLLAVVFVQQINKAYKKGIFRKYRNFEGNDAKVKGKIDVSRHIKLNPLFNGKIAYSYREYTINNDINRLILTAFSMLEKKEPLFIKNLLDKYKNVKECMQQFRNYMTPASHQEISGMLRKSYNKVTHSVYKDWEAVRKTAIMILRHMGVNISGHDNNQIFGVLCNINKVWEEYLKGILDTAGLDINVETQKKMEILEKRRKLMPDFYLEKAKNRVVLDAKYKENWSKIVRDDNCNWEDVREDVFQVLSYMYAFRCGAGGIICPAKEDKEHKPIKVFDDDEHKRTEQFFVLPLYIPNNEHNERYDDFKKKMKTSEENLAQKIKAIFNKEIDKSTIPN